MEKNGKVWFDVFNCVPSKPIILILVFINTQAPNAWRGESHVKRKKIEKKSKRRKGRKPSLEIHLPWPQVYQIRVWNIPNMTTAKGEPHRGQRNDHECLFPSCLVGCFHWSLGCLSYQPRLSPATPSLPIDFPQHHHFPTIF